MFKKLIKNKKAQNTAEYAILISLVVAGIIAMQTYAQRALQAGVRDAGKHLASEGDIGTPDASEQYEPYYLSTDYTVVRNEFDEQRLDTGRTSQFTNSIRTRQQDGFQESTYDPAIFNTGV